MSDIQEALFEHLEKDSNISDRVGSRIYPSRRSDSNRTTPYLVYSEVSADTIRSLNGPSGLAKTRVQTDAYSPKKAIARLLGRDVRLALDGYDGMMGLTETVMVQGVTLEDRQDLYEEDPQLHRRRQDFFIWYEEEVPA